MQAIRVLVVEDDAGLRSAVVRALTGADLQAEAVGDAAAALQHLERGGADVVVLDIGLPDADGRDLCQAMRARGLVAPVLFLTARGHVSDVLSGYAAGGMTTWRSRSTSTSSSLGSPRWAGARRPLSPPRPARSCRTWIRARMPWSWALRRCG